MLNSGALVRPEPMSNSSVTNRINEVSAAFSYQRTAVSSLAYNLKCG